MPVLSTEEIIGKNVVTTDAYLIGEIRELRYNPRNWTVAGVVMTGSAGVYDLLPSPMAKSLVMLKPGKAVIRDVYMVSEKRESLMKKLVADNPMLPALSSLLKMKVELLGGVLLGTVVVVEVDPVTWEVRSLKVRLDKSAMKEMGVKGILPKTVSGLMSSSISTVTDRVVVKKTMTEIQRSLIIE